VADLDHFATCPGCHLAGSHHATLLPASPPLRREVDLWDGETATICSWSGLPPRVQRQCVFCGHHWQTDQREDHRA
jgi:hypothetical protein